MISVENLSKIYSLGRVKVRALDDVSMDISEGEMIGVMDKSGSGKSTLLRQLGLIDWPTTGKIMMDYQDITNLPENRRSRLRLSRLGYIFQEYALLPELTAQENVCLPAMMLGKKRKQYHAHSLQLLELVGLKDRITHRPRELSGGEQQRVAIARSLVNNPEIIFADEPCANLDSVASEVVMETLARLNKELKVTVVFVSHDPDDKKYAKKLIFLKDGKIVPKYLNLSSK
ncbi:MAG: ABC transporter ATP-binding protein [bacterium]|nr:ABC transporter ATP-binding protein [bacterium]